MGILLLAEGCLFANRFLVRDAAYSLLTDENLIIAHRLAGHYLEQVGGIDPAVLAEHAHQGQEPAHLTLPSAKPR